MTEPDSPRTKPPAIERRYLVVKRSDVLVIENEGAPSLLREEHLTALGLTASDAHDAGEIAGESTPEIAGEITGDRHARFAARALVWPHDPRSKDAPPGFAWRGLRGLYGAVDEATFAACGRAVHLADWATTSRFCGACGAATERAEGERAMRCPSCKNMYYPRIAPAVIVLVRRGEEALLARGARFPLPFFSTLAGFSEIGESLEETLVREVREEVGIEIHRARYFGSQPWPFPHSLMIGFTAEYKSGELALDPNEIAEAAWFRADALPMVPPKISIARALIDAWVAEVSGR
jgi:NAD+ diphosphatase